MARYKGRIPYYKMWNEPNLKNSYTGFVDSLVALTKRTKEIMNQIDPSAKVISPSVTGPTGATWLEQFLAREGGRFVDIIGFHPYTHADPPGADGGTYPNYGGRDE